MIRFVLERMSPRRANRILKWYYLFTAMGTVVHEYAHKEFAESAGLEIIEVDWFSLDGGPLGKVKHSQPKTYKQMISISVAPFLVNSSFAVTIFSVIFGYLSIASISSVVWWQWLLIAGGVWMGISLGLHAFPSSTDISNVTMAGNFLWNERKPKAKDWAERKSTKPTTPSMSLLSIGRQIKRIFVIIVLSPIWLVFSAIHILIFSLLHMEVIFASPFIALLKFLDMTKRYGSHFLFTCLLVVVAYTTSIEYTETLLRIAEKTI